MYLNHYNLQLKPFQISTDPRFLWLGENHKEAFAVLKYGILDNRGFLLLTGDVGTGKTTLIHALVNSLGDEVVTATVPDPSLEPIDFFNYISNSFGIPGKFAGKGEFIAEFRTFLCDVYDRHKRSLLIIDEAQLLKHEVLEEIRLLSNIEKQNTKLLNIFFVGQNEFNDLLWEDRNRALRQRITVNYNVYALSQEETGDYIRHRLKIAGTTRKIFTDSAIREIAEFSEGFPRTINIVCDHALLTGFVKGVNKIDHRVVRECIKDIQIPRSALVKEADVIRDSAPEAAGEETPRIRTTVSGKKLGWHKYAAAYAVLFVIAFYIMGYIFEAPIIRQFNRSVSHLWLQAPTDISDSGKTPEADQHASAGIPIRTADTGDAGDADADKTPQPAKGSHPVVSESSDTGHNADTDVPAAGSQGKEDAVDMEGAIEVSMIDQPEGDAAVDHATDDAPPAGLEPPREGLEAGMSKEDKSIIALLRGKVIVNFSHNSNEVSEDAVEILEKIADVLIRYPDVKVGVIGYTDSSGIYSYNKSLSRFRANIVKSYLTGKGAKQEQVTAIGMGPQNPLEPNSTWQGRKSNRRVEIVLYEDNNKGNVTN